MSRRSDRRRGIGVSDVADGDELLKELVENQEDENEVNDDEGTEELREEGTIVNESPVVDKEEARGILGALNEATEDEIQKEYEPVLDEIKQDEIIDGASDDVKEEVRTENVDRHAQVTPKFIEESRVSFEDVKFGEGITKDLRNMNNKNLGGNGRMRTTKLSEIILGKLPKVQAGRNLSNFRGFNFILEPQDILKFVGEAINEFNPEAKLAIDRIKASTIVGTILQTTDNIDEGKESRNALMDRMALEMTGLGFAKLKDLKDNQIDVITLQLPRKGYTTQGDPDNIIGGGMKKDYIKAGTILEEFGIITPTKYVPATLFTGDDELRIDGGIQVFTDLFKMSLICTCALYNIFALTDAIGPKGGKVAVEVGSKGYGTYEVFTYLNKGIQFVK